MQLQNYKPLSLRAFAPLRETYASQRINSRKGAKAQRFEALRLLI
jgi:hypothetical protein